ncbi:hypothetical protein [Streptomyces sp. NPDC047071]|uniref:hypothetical protein n=1 Tax=Streptomyces sp. NPDC047071 TaxID=3154808 RepID=UPI003454CCF2
MIYQHSPSRDAVRRTLLERGNGELAQRMRAAVAGEPASRGPYLAAAAYLEFAWSRPGLYQLVSGAPGTDVDAATRRAAADDAIAFTGQLKAARKPDRSPSTALTDRHSGRQVRGATAGGGTP